MPRRPVHKACDDFRQTSASTRARWLEQPTTRRRVLLRGVGAGLSVYAAQAMSLGRVLEAAGAQAQAAPNAPVLVAVFLPGGLDLLDTLVPLGQYGRYADLRKAGKVNDALALGSTGLGVHPSLGQGTGGGLKGLYDAGKVAFIPGIDYANPDLSHFHSRHFWETGLITDKGVPGWLGRWLDRHGSADNPLQGLSLDYSLSPVLQTATAPVASVSSPNDAQLGIRGVYGKTEEHALAAWAALSQRRPKPPGPAAAFNAARLAKGVGDLLAPYQQHDNSDPLAPPVPYPADNDLGQKLSRLAAMISVPLGVRVATVDAGGDFDTHDNQPKELQTALAAVSSALAAFQADLQVRGVADRVLTFVWSEFGRRPAGNDSLGTDHGAGGVGWVMGNRAASGIASPYPSLDQFDSEDNLAVTVDFRAVYSTLIERWLGTDPGEVIPNAGAFGRLNLVR
jgi:uncharacterized protein (DUF1501 family)